MKNKFKFNFKFLDRFLKPKNNAESVDDVEHDEIDDDNDEPIQFQEMKRPNVSADSESEKTHTHTHTHTSTLNSTPITSEDDETADQAHHEHSSPNIYREAKSSNSTDDEVYTDENPEEFAEKTLSNFNLKKFQEENGLINDEENEANSLPSSPEVATRFKFKFPSFNRQEVTDKIKNRLSSTQSPIKTFDKFNWNDLILRLFSPYTRGKIHGLFIILLVVTVTYLFGKGIALFISRSTPIVATVKSNIQLPNEKADTSIQDLNKISSTNLFNVKESDKAQNKKQEIDIASIVCLDAQTPTSQPVKLLDTIVLQDSVKSVAAVQIRGSGELMNVREGEQLSSSIEVAKINRMRLILKNLETGECEYVASEEEEGPSLPPLKIISASKAKKIFSSNNPSIKNVGNSFTIKRQFRDQMINNMSEILTQAKAIQITNPDGSLSFKMTEVVPGSIYSQLNIQENDIINSINGKKIENLNELMGLLGKIKEIDQFEIGLKRNGMNENLEYNFK